MVVELKISVSDCEKRRLSRDFLVYEDVTFREEDPIIQKCVKELLDEFKGEPDDIKIKASMVIT